MKFIIFILLVFLFFGCKSANINRSQKQNQNNYSYYREDGLMKEEFWGKGENSDIPNIFEAVSIDKSGKPDGKGGDTHFHFLNEEVGINYQIYDSTEIALQKLNQSIEKADKIIRRGIIKNSNGEAVGQKVLFIQKSKITKEIYYLLVWTRNSRFTTLSSSSLKTIEEYEKDREL